MIENKIRTLVPMMMLEQQQRQDVQVRTFLNGKLIKNGDIVKGVKDLITDAFKHLGKKR